MWALSRKNSCGAGREGWRQAGAAGAECWSEEMEWSLREGSNSSEGKILQVPSEDSHHLFLLSDPETIDTYPDEPVTFQPVRII